MTLTIPALSGELQAEFDAWEQAADEDMARLNAEEGLEWISPVLKDRFGGADANRSATGR